MIVNCTHCGSRFDVDDEMLRPSGRKLKCSGCKDVFFQPPPPPESKPEEEPFGAEFEETPEEPSEDSFGEAFEEVSEGSFGEEFEEASEEPFGAEFEEEEEEETVLATSMTGGYGPSADDPSDAETVVGDAFGDGDAVGEDDPWGEDPEEEMSPMLPSDSIDGEGLEPEPDDDDAFSDDMFEEEPFEEDPFSEEFTGMAEPETSGGLADPDEVTTLAGPGELTEPPLDEAADDGEGLDPEEEDYDEESSSPAVTGKKNRGLWAVAAALLVILGVGLVGRTDWWTVQWYELNEPFRLQSVDGVWRVHDFGTLLVVAGDLGNGSRVTQDIPKVRVTLMDANNAQLSALSVIPGRVIPDTLLDESSEATIRAAATLQTTKPPDRKEKLWPDKGLPFQAIFFNPSEQAARFQVDFEVPGAAAARSSSGARTFGGKF